MFTLEGAGYKNILAIESLTIPPLVTTCIVGESGSGKTTILKLLNHLLSCDRGRVLFKEEDIKTLDPVELRRAVVMLPQTPLIFPGTIKDNLLLGLQFGGKPLPGDDALVSILAKMSLKKELTDSAVELSGGEKQRLAICRLMLMDPEVLLLDEPTSALDDKMEDAVMDLLVSYAQTEQKTLILITHSRELARKYGDVIITLEKGKVSKVAGRDKQWQT